MLSVAYEYCLMKFAEQEGRRAGEFYTPQSIVKTLTQSVDIAGGRVYDPCCGSGGMLVQAAKEMVKRGGSKRDISFYGQESNPTTWKMCLMNLAVHGIEANVGPYNADAFLQDIHAGLKADYILASPPFNMSEWGAERLLGDARWQFGMPPAGNANFAWLQHMIYHLSQTGRMGVVLSNGTLTSQVGSEGEIRKKIICADLVECIVSMPGKLFYNTAIPVSIWFINKAKAPHQRGKVLFIDAGGFPTHGAKELTPEQIRKISGQVCAYRSNMDYKDEPGFCVVADTERIQENDFTLVPSRYVGISESVLSLDRCESSLASLTEELKNILHENQRLGKELKKKLEVLGYDL